MYGVLGLGSGKCYHSLLLQSELCSAGCLQPADLFFAPEEKVLEWV
jgi:hypothetical protein